MADAVQLYGIFNDGGNCWSRYRGSERWYWAKSWADENETPAKFRARHRGRVSAKPRRTTESTSAAPMA